MLKKNKKLQFKIAVGLALFVLAAAAFLFFGEPVLAGSADNMLWDNQAGNFQAATGLGNLDIRIVIARIIRYILGFLGIIAVVIIMYGGWVYMTSQGDESRISQAKKIIINAVIGLVIVLMSFSIATFVINSLFEATNPSGNSTSPGRSRFGLGATGNSVIENHYPSRNQKNVPRNTMIIITFKEPMEVVDIVSAGNINAGNILIYPTATAGAGPFVSNVAASAMPDMKTFRFDPIEYLGSPSENVWYTVELTNAIRKANGDLAFPGASGGYAWSFEVSTLVDTTPPRIISIVPSPDTTEPRNVVIQINFNEPIDPTSASGPTTTFNNIEVNNLTIPGLVTGNFYISNLYRTVEFLTEEDCGVNSCGQTIYCLPGNSNLSATVSAATLAVAGSPVSSFPYDGIVDMASNSLDGNSDNLAQGPEAQSGQPPYNMNSPDPLTQGDDYIWNFRTNNNIDITAPVIDSFEPAIGASNIGFDVEPQATFSKRIMSSSLTRNSPPATGSVSLYPDPGTSEVFFWMEKADSAGRTAVYIKHEDFLENSDYIPEFNSGVRDLYQNCYNPGAGPGCTPSLPSQPYCCDDFLSANSCAP